MGLGKKSLMIYEVCIDINLTSDTTKRF